MSYDLLLDATGLRCPIPIIRTKLYISKLTKGQKLLVWVTDPSYYVDCRVFVRQTGHLLLQSWQEGEKFCYLLEKQDLRKTVRARRNCCERAEFTIVNEHREQ